MSEEKHVTRVYDDYAIRHNAAYTVFRQTYELENPRPSIETVSRDVVSLIIILALTIVSIASIIVSGSRTIEEFGGGLIGTIAFVMIEGGIMAYGFFIARRNANKERLKNTVKWAMAGLVLTVIVGLGANADAVLKKHGINIPTEVNIFINLLVALSAPTLAFISSDVLAIELMATEIRRRDAILEHDKKLKKWLKDMNATWRGEQRNWGAKIKIEKPEQPKIEAVSHVSVTPDTIDTKEKKPSKEMLKAIQWLELNPEALNRPSRELTQDIGVSHMTIFRAQEYLKKQSDG